MEAILYYGAIVVLCIIGAVVAAIVMSIVGIVILAPFGLLIGFCNRPFSFFSSSGGSGTAHSGSSPSECDDFSALSRQDPPEPVHYIKKPGTVTYLILVNALIGPFEDKYGPLTDNEKTGLFIAFKLMTEEQINNIYHAIKTKPLQTAYLTKMLIKTFHEKRAKGESLTLFDLYVFYQAMCL